MRDYKFRGKRKDNGEWVCGSSLVCVGGAAWITRSDNVWFEVDPSTVGEFTGLKDKDGVEIYEGDILRDTFTGDIRHVLYEAPSFALCDENRFFYRHFHSEEYEVIGNVHDNPELLEEVIAKAREGAKDA